MKKLLLVCGLLVAAPLYAQDRTETVRQVKAQLEARGVSLAGPCGAFEITGRVAFIFRAEGWGLIAKNPGQNGCTINGARYAVDALTKQDGSAWVDLLVNSETDNGPAWQLHEGAGPDGLWRAPFAMDGDVVIPPSPTPPTPPPSSDAVLLLLLQIRGELNSRFDTLDARTLHILERIIAAPTPAPPAPVQPVVSSGTPWWKYLGRFAASNEGKMLIGAVMGAVAGLQMGPP